MLKSTPGHRVHKQCRQCTCAAGPGTAACAAKRPQPMPMAQVNHIVHTAWAVALGTGPPWQATLAQRLEPAPISKRH